jgi:GT2 family glycosyltransferase
LVRAIDIARLPLYRWLPENPLFDREWYLGRYADVRANGVDPYRHFRLHGAQEGRDPNELFDTSWYLDRYPDVRRGSRNPLDHYLRSGWREGRDPGPHFSTVWYLDQNADVRAVRMNPLLHYLRHGKAEGRLPAPGGGGTTYLRPAEASRQEVAQPATRIARRFRGSAASQRVLTEVQGLVPKGATVAVLNGRDHRLLQLPGAVAHAFPRSPRAVGNSTSAIAALESERADGVQYLVLPAAQSGLLADCPGLSHHLERYRSVASDPDICAIHDLRHPVREASVLRQLADATEHRCPDRQASVLAWGVPLDSQAFDPGLRVFAPPVVLDRSLPFVDDSVDIVAIDSHDNAIVREAIRVATTAVIRLGTAFPEVVWQAEPGAFDQPSVSVVIPTFNRSDLVRTCLQTLDETRPAGFQIEVVVVDDGSDSAEAAELDALDAKVVRNERNLGFLASANRGAAEATGDYLLFLNNDTILLPGWLPPLVRTFQDRTDAGAVGGKLVFPDGTLQEAGGIVYADGSAANYGRGDPNPEAPLYSFLREVDYVSGSMLLTPRSLFERLGGFDDVYGFGYYEDADYCFRIRESGLRVYFQPESVIVHREGGSAGTDIASGAKQFQSRNRPIFVDRWRHRLAQQSASTAVA